MLELGTIKLILLAVFLAFFLAAERLRPFAPLPKSKGRLFTNAGLWSSVLPVSPLFVVPVSLWAASYELWVRPEWWSGWRSILIDLIILDFWIYWMHRTFHAVPFLWRFHEIHHRDETLDATSAVRFHFGEVMISAAVRAVFLILLAVPIESVLIFETVAALSAIFQHSNVKLPPTLEKWISYAFVTPSIHWIHHHEVEQDTNSNYCNIFSLWDIVFGTRSKTQRTPDLPIGLDYTHDIPFPKIILQPFLKRK